MKRALSGEQVVAQVKKLFFIYTCCQEEISNLVCQSGLKEIGEMFGRIKLGYKHMIDALLENCSQLEEQLKIEIGRKTQHIFEGHPLRDAPKEIKVNYWGMHQPKLKFLDEAADKLDFGDDQEKVSRDKAERERIEKKVTQLMQKLDNGERVDLEEIEDYKTGFEYCRRLCDSIKQENEELHAKMFLQLRSIENTQAKMGTNALEAVEIIQSELVNAVAPSLQSSITQTPKPDVDPNLYDVTEQEFLDSFTGKYKMLAQQILDKLWAAKLARPAKSTETQLSSVHINQMSHSNEGKLILKIAKLEFALSESQKQTNEVKIRISMLESLNNELVQEIQRRENEILDLYYKMGMTSSDNAIRERMKDLEDLKSRTIGIVSTETGGGIAKYQTMVQQTLMKVVQTGGEALQHCETDESAKQMSEKFKNAIKDIIKNIVPDDLKTGLKRDDPFGLEDAMRVSLSPPKMLPKIKLSKKQRELLMGGAGNEPSVHKSTHLTIGGSKRNSRTVAPQFSDDENDQSVRNKSRERSAIQSGRKPKKSQRQKHEPGKEHDDQTKKGNGPLGHLASFVNNKLMPRKTLRGTLVPGSSEQPYDTKLYVPGTSPYDRDNSDQHQGGQNSVSYSKLPVTQSDLSVDADPDKPKPSRFKKFQLNPTDADYQQTSSRSAKSRDEKLRSLDSHKDHQRVFDLPEVKNISFSEEFLSNNPLLKEDLLKLAKLAVGFVSVTREYKFLIGRKRVVMLPSDLDKRSPHHSEANAKQWKGAVPEGSSDRSLRNSVNRKEGHSKGKQPKDKTRVEDDLHQEMSDFENQALNDQAQAKLRETGFSRWKYNTQDAAESAEKQRAASLKNLTREQRGLLKHEIVNESQRLTDSQKYMLKKYGGRPGDYKNSLGTEGSATLSRTGPTGLESSSHFHLSGLYALDGLQRVRPKRPNYDFEFYSHTNNHSKKSHHNGSHDQDLEGSVDLVDQHINPFNHLNNSGEVDDQFIIDMYDVIEQPLLDLSHQTVIPRDVVHRNPLRVQELRTKVNEFVKTHFSCGTVCKHLVAFYQRIGLLKAVGWYHNGRQQLILPHIDIGDSKIVHSINQRKALNSKLKLWTVMYMKHMPVKLPPH